MVVLEILAKPQSHPNSFWRMGAISGFSQRVYLPLTLNPHNTLPLFIDFLTCCLILRKLKLFLSIEIMLYYYHHLPFPYYDTFNLVLLLLPPPLPMIWYLQPRTNILNKHIFGLRLRIHVVRLHKTLWLSEMLLRSGWAFCVDPHRPHWKTSFLYETSDRKWLLRNTFG